MHPRNAQTCFGIFGGGMFWIALVFDGNGFIPFVLSMWPRYCISFVKKWHFLSFIDRCALCSFLKTCFMWSRCSSAVLLKIMMLSRYAMMKLKSFNIPVMSSWKYAGACASPNCTLTYSKFPNGEVKAVLGMASSSKRMWWYPALRSNVEKYFVQFSWEKISSTLGIDRWTTLLSCWGLYNQLLNVFLHLLLVLLLSVLTNLICFPRLLSLWITFLFHLLPIANVSWQMDKAAVTQVPNFLCLWTSLRGVLFQ